jgi:aspartyl-tRNA(Asn)/glutamyl-tRNA(Gln) amidotransferase subunit C
LQYRVTDSNSENGGKVSVTIKDVEHVAELARLAFSDEEKQKLMKELNSILEYMEQLNSLDTSNVEPLSHVIELNNVFRDDTLKPTLPREEALKNAPAKTEKFFKVPKVIGDR